MFAAFLLPFPVRGVRAPYLWFYYRLLHDFEEPALFICSPDYNISVDKWAEDGRWEVTSGACDKLGYALPDENFVSHNFYEHVPGNIFNELLVRYNGNPTKVFHAILTDEILTLINFFREVLRLRGANIEAVLTLCNCPSLSVAAAEVGIPVVHIELGPLRAPEYLSTAYFDFSGVNGNTEARSRYLLSSDLQLTGVKREDLLGIFRCSLHTTERGELESNNRIGVALQIEDDSNIVSFGNGFNNQDLVNLVRLKYSGQKISIRHHPGSLFEVKSNFAERDDSDSVEDFINRCEHLFVINSSVGLEALLLGKIVTVLGECSYRFILDAEDDGEFIRRLSFYLFAYLVPLSIVTDPQYIRFRLRRPSEREIIMKHLVESLKVQSEMLAALSEKAGRLNQLVAERDKQVDNLGQVVAERDKQVDNLGQVVAERDKQVDNLSQVVAERDKQVDNLSQVVAERNRQVDDLNQVVAERDKQVDNLSQVVAERNRQVESSNSELITIRESVQVLKKSRSWQITSPLRWVGHQYRRIVFLKRIMPLLQVDRGRRRSLLGKVVRVYHYEGMNGIRVKVRNFVSRQVTQDISVHVTPSIVCNDGDAPSVYDVICFSIIEWNHRFQRPQHLMKQYSDNGHRVFYLNLTFHNSSKDVVVRELAERIYQIQLPGPLDFDRFRQSLPADVVDHAFDALERFIDEVGIRDAISMVQLPLWAPFAVRLRDKFGWKIVFDCMDEHQGLTILDPSMCYDESLLVRKADLVVVSAKKLWCKHSKNAQACLMLPNAVDFNHFNSTFSGEDPLAKIPRPIVGYFGAIMEWFDSEVVKDAACMRPDWSFVLIGNVDTESVSSLCGLPNIHFLGEKPYAVLPDYLHAFDVCMIPFKLTQIIESTNPVKFYEYLSAGKPTVASPMPELCPFVDLFYPAANVDDFIRQVDMALHEDDPGLAVRRISWARGETWESRYNALSTSVKALHGLVSIVIVSYQNMDKLELCIQSIIEKTQYPNYEVVVVDNGSSDDVISYLERIDSTYGHFRVIFNRENAGFARANNIGLSAISPDSRYIVLLNNDTVVTFGWLNRLVYWLGNMNVGLVGPVTCPNGAANEAAVPVDYDCIDEIELFARKYTTMHRGQSFEIGMLAMYCVAMRRDIYNEIGPLDERFGVGMFEDDDYSLRVRMAGYNVICAEDVFVHHFGRSSFSKLSTGNYLEIFRQNLNLYEEKWGIKWQTPSGRDLIECRE